MKSPLNKVILFMFCIALLMCALINSASAFSIGAANSSGNAQMVASLNKTYDLLKSWSADNKRKEEALKLYANKSALIVDKNSQYQKKEAWQEVLELNKNSLMLLEASYAFAKQTQSYAELKENSLRTKAWEDCLNMEECNFKTLNQMMDDEALKLSSFTKNNAIKTQEMLLDSIDKLQNFNQDGKSAKGLNSSIDALSKINATQANALIYLTNQISNLTKLAASESQANLQEKQLEQKSNEQVFGSSKINSPHFKVELKEYD